MKRAELLSPAGSVEGLMAAINNGADAVYLGLSNFNARKKAQNFDENDLAKWIRLAHLYGVKVYVTLNTLVKNSETEDFLNAVESAAKAGADAFIVQSLGNARLIKRVFPGVELHASTQMGICNRYGARLCLDEGISHVILPRECSLKDIEDISGSADIELEAFIHGALCMSFSGNCFMSSFLSCNSGNRGMCLQPCRMFYSAYRDEELIKEGYLLSLSDLKVGKMVDRLLEAGVTCFKIEGRMRRPEYTAIATSYYRKIIDGIEPSPEDEYSLEAAYNRGGFTEGHCFGSSNLFSTVHQAHMGVFVGKVGRIFNDTLELKSAHRLGEGDGFKLFDEQGRECGSAVFHKRIAEGVYSLKFKGSPKIGTNVHITTDKYINELYLERKRYLPVDLSFSAKIGKPCELVVKYGDISLSLKSDYIAEKGNKNIVGREFVYKKLKKLNDIFEARNIETDIEKDVFIPLSVLTSLKNDLALLLENRILERYNKPVIRQDIPNPHSTMQSTLRNSYSTMQAINKAVIGDDPEILNAFSTDAYALIYKPQDYEESEFEYFFSRIKPEAIKKLYLCTPYFTGAADLEVIQKLLSKYSFKGLFINNVSAILLAKECGLELFGGVGLNVFNDYDVLFIEDFCKDYTLSQELSQKEIEDLTYSGNAFVFSYGEIELMSLANCLIKAMGADCKACTYGKGMYLRDKKGENFFIRRYKISRCYFNIINGRKLCSLKNITGSMLFNFSNENLPAALSAYNLVRPEGDFTGGHFHRAVK